MANRRTPYRAAEPAPAEADDVEAFRAQLGASHRWAQRVTRLRDSLRRVGRAVGKVAPIVQWLDDPVREGKYALLDEVWRLTPWGRARRRREQAPPRDGERQGQ